MTEAARRAEEREERRREREERFGRYEGVPTPEERLRSVFSSDIPENMLERYARAPAAATRRRSPSFVPSAGGITEPVLRVVGVGGAGVNAVNRMVEAAGRGRRVHRREHRPPVAGGIGGRDARAHRQRHHPRARLRGRTPSSAARRRSRTTTG